ncbi:MAG: LIC_10190 family membrane protein [Bacteroidia bacterium]
MILLVLYYIIVFFIATVLGIYTSAFLKQKHENVFYNSVFGIAIISLLSIVFFISGPVNLSALLVIIVLPVVLIWLKPNVFIAEFKSIKNFYQSLDLIEKVYVFTIITIISYQSAQASLIHDDGMYYQQTILWAQKHGITKGLANLHPAFGLFSSWHLFTALIDTANLGLPAFHHYNGLILLAFILYFVFETKINPQFNAFSKLFLIVLPLLGYMFLTAPNTDLPLILVTILLFYNVIIKNQKDISLFLLSIFAFTIKPSALLAILIGFILFYYTLKSKKIIVYLMFTMIFGFLIIYKNIVLSGYPLYPLSFPNVTSVEWKVPEEVNQFYKTGIKSWGVSDSFKINEIAEIGSEKIIKRFNTWITRGGYKGLMNKLMLTFVLIFGLLFVFKNKSDIKALVTILILFCVIILDWLYLTQYRLMLPTFVVLVLYVWHKTELININKKFLLITSLLLIIIAFVPFSLLNQTSRNKSITNFKGFNTKYLVLPFSQFYLGENNKRYNKFGSFNYYEDLSYCWQCPLPCQSMGQINLLNYYGYEAAYIDTNNYAKGFKLVRIN